MYNRKLLPKNKSLYRAYPAANDAWAGRIFIIF